MKKYNFVMMLVALAVMLVLPACGNDEPDWRDRDVTAEYEMLNHVCDNGSADASVAKVKNKLVFHRADLTADVLMQLDGENLDVKDLKLKLDDETGRYTCSAASTSNSRITNLAMNVDFNEQSMDIYYTVDGKRRVMCTMPQVFFLGNSSTLTYDDGKTSNDKASIYTFDIDPASMTATMKVSPLTNEQVFLVFETIIARSIAVKATPDGYELEAERPEVVSVLRRIDSSAGTLTTTDARDSNGHQLYPMRGMKAKLSLVSGVHETTFTMGSVEEKTQPFTVKAKGSFYKEKNIK